MASRRMLSKTISISVKVNQLTDREALLYTWLIPHLDDFGRIEGEPEVIKALIFPMRKINEKEICKILGRLVDIGLIIWYRSGKKLVIELTNFDEFQTNLHRRTASKLPKASEQAILYNSLNFPEIPRNSGKFRPNLTELNLTELNLTELNAQNALVLGFEKFWEAYPRKRSKEVALNAWRKINPDEQLQNRIIRSLERAKTLDFRNRDSDKIPYPATWLNAHGWEDELAAEPPSQTQSLFRALDKDLREGRITKEFYEQEKRKVTSNEHNAV